VTGAVSKSTMPTPGSPSVSAPEEPLGARRRRCVATRRVASRDALIRFVLGPDRAVVPDIGGRLPGRGLWLSADRDVVHTACARNLFAKGFHAEAVPAPDLAATVEGLLARRCGDLLGLARRAGRAATGYEKVRARLASWRNGARGGVLVIAAGAAVEGRDKLRRLAPDAPVVSVLSGEEMSAALGRENAVYAAIDGGRLGERLLVEAARLAGFRRLDEASLNAMRTIGDR